MQLKILKTTTHRRRPLPRNRGALGLARHHILGKIANGEFPAGTALSEVPLATELGISRTPIREAIGQLVAEGMLQKSNRGAIVAEPTRQDIIELYDLREALEVHAIGKVAAQRLSPRMLEPLEALVEEMRILAIDRKKAEKGALDSETLRKFLTCDMRFHLLLLQAAGNQRMLKILDSTNLLLRVFSLPREHHTGRLVNDVYRFHRRILDSIASGSRAEAMQLLGEHIRLSLEERLAEYDGAQQMGREW
jgi:DNA-binding GntR family transcriptional regulator